MAKLQFAVFATPNDGLRSRIEVFVPTEDVEHQKALLGKIFPTAQIKTESSALLDLMITSDNPENQIINVDSTPEVTRIIILDSEKNQSKCYLAMRARRALGE